MLEIITGDDEVIPVTLKKNGATFAISGTAQIKAAIIDQSHTRVLAGPVTVSPTTPGSNWASSLLIVEIPGTQTEKLKAQQAKLEIQVLDDGRKKTWHVPANLKKGVIE